MSSMPIDACDFKKWCSGVHIVGLIEDDFKIFYGVRQVDEKRPSILLR